MPLKPSVSKLLFWTQPFNLEMLLELLSELHILKTEKNISTKVIPVKHSGREDYTEGCYCVILASLKFTFTTLVISFQVVPYNFQNPLEYMISLDHVDDPMTVLRG